MLIAKGVPHSMIPEPFTREISKIMVQQQNIKVIYFFLLDSKIVKFQIFTSQHDIQAVHMKWIRKIIPQ